MRDVGIRDAVARGARRRTPVRAAGIAAALCVVAALPGQAWAGPADGPGDLPRYKAAVARGARRRTPVRAAGIAAALCVVAALPGQAWAGPADGPGDLPRYKAAEDAKKIKGALSSGDGPEIRPGVYSDTIGKGEKKYYSVSLDAKSAAFLSAVAAPEPGARVQTVGEGLELSLQAVDGSPCDGSAQSDFSGDGSAYAVADYAARVVGADDECQKAGPYLFSVERVGGDTSNPARWPLEIRYMSEPPVKGTLPSAPTGNGAGDDPPAALSGSAKRRAHGGTGFNDAGAVSEGVWKDRIRPGETRFYRVPVDWGQRLNAAVELSSVKSTEDFPPTVYNGLGLTTYNPARGRFDDESFVSYTPDKSAQAVAYTPVVDFGNRFADEGSDAALAGWHYLAVTVSPKAGQVIKGTAPLTLRIDLKGKAKAGPGYEGDAAAAGFGVSDQDREQAEKGQNAAEGQRSGTLMTVAYAGIGTGTALILALVLWTLVARRAAAGAAGAPAGGTPPGPPLGGGAYTAPGQGRPGTTPAWPEPQQPYGEHRTQQFHDPRRQQQP
ncbi:hypothetical protein H181DRAFT_01689 [Streptomyces sp. WMMB 714]|nr:hypothetical protein H181DRAFT_01689 [Streptomyces sp. WMMB 714]